MRKRCARCKVEVHATPTPYISVAVESHATSQVSHICLECVDEVGGEDNAVAFCEEQELIERMEAFDESEAPPITYH